MSTFSKILRFSSDPSTITSLGITLMLMLMGFIYYYFYSMASSSNASEPKEEESSSYSSEPKIMVSTPTSSIQKRFKYDVYLSFRGEDTSKNFLGHLYEALKAKGIYTYKDDVRIHKGITISDELIKAIEDSKFYIIVFSKNYASSSWCLDELVKIMECQKMDEHTAYPVFYDVEPTQVRKQIGAVGQAFEKHENEEAAGKWREALKEAADLNRTFFYHAYRHEAEFIKKIVREILLELRPINSGFDERLVGMETRVKDVVSSNSSEPKEEESSSYSSTSTSSIQKRFKYDVFLSFRGEDTRKNFLGHLYEALTTKGIVTYKDDVRIHKGEPISDELIKAIEDSRFYIIVFSNNYASSSWCLDELVKIMECRKMTGHTAYPVFYDVEPTQVRKQIGAVGQAFVKHKNEVAAGKWREALKEAAGLAGWGLNDGDESELIKKIVGLISLELRSISFGPDEKLVGMETRVKDVVDSLEMGIDDDVWMIGIKGMGGAGKTTTARAVYDHLSADFEAKSFVENVREVTEPSMSGLKKLQEQVLSRVLNEQVTLDSVDDGINMMQKRMRGIKVLLVLDDVNDIDQLVALAGETNWFKKGSRIIVTTRDEQVLKAHRVKFRDIDLLSDKVDHRVKIRDIDLLSNEEAIFLFSRHAFGRPIPSQGFKKLSEKVVSYAAGLPLTVEVLGSFLCGKNEHEWVKAIDRLKKFPPEKILKKLELSYESLEYDYQQIFLDIACILKGLRIGYAIRILECCGFEPITGLRVLEQRSLITVDEYGFLGMHDQIEDMGKNIVRREHRDEPNKRSRLWIKKEVEDILADDEGTEATRCLKLIDSNTNAGTVMKGLGKMKQLRYLELHFPDEDYYQRDAGCLDDTSQYFPNSFKYLKCLHYPFLYLPKTFQANNLVGLEMVGGRMEQLWEEGEKKVALWHKRRIKQWRI